MKCCHNIIKLSRASEVDDLELALERAPSRRDILESDQSIPKRNLPLRQISRLLRLVGKDSPGSAQVEEGVLLLNLRLSDRLVRRRSSDKDRLDRRIWGSVWTKRVGSATIQWLRRIDVSTSNPSRANRRRGLASVRHRLSSIRRALGPGMANRVSKALTKVRLTVNHPNPLSIGRRPLMVARNNTADRN